MFNQLPCRWLIFFMTTLSFCTGCAAPGYHYEAGDFFHQTPNDVCKRPQISSTGAVSWLNTSIGKSNGVPTTVAKIENPESADRLTLASIGLRFPTNQASVLCHAILVFYDQRSESGVISVSDFGKYAPLDVEWISDFDIARQRAKVERLENNKNLPVTPDLNTKSVQLCVGRETALGVSEQYSGQLWVACAYKLGLIAVWQ